ncbi:MAG: hypothetical protein LBS49_02615, partial [Candidatus Accumulibacter sp.]|nr:hypothetical protein [Accumulibacter sp.]
MPAFDPFAGQPGQAAPGGLPVSLEAASQAPGSGLTPRQPPLEGEYLPAGEGPPDRRAPVAGLLESPVIDSTRGGGTDVVPASRALGLDPSLGMMSEAAALAVDSGVAQVSGDRGQRTEDSRLAAASPPVTGQSSVFSPQSSESGPAWDSLPREARQDVLIQAGYGPDYARMVSWGPFGQLAPELQNRISSVLTPVQGDEGSPSAASPLTGESNRVTQAIEAQQAGPQAAQAGEPVSGQGTGVAAATGAIGQPVPNAGNLTPEAAGSLWEGMNEAERRDWVRQVSTNPVVVQNVPRLPWSAFQTNTGLQQQLA